MQKLNVGCMVFVALILGGCSASSVLKPYPSQMAATKQEIAAGQLANVQLDLDKKRESADKILYMMERGRVSQLLSDFDSSINDFSVVIDAMKEHEEKARITATGAAAQTSAIFTNDNAIPYAGEPYERVFVHNYQALNYLFKNDLEAAGVEVRRANLEQQNALRKYSDEVEDAKEGKDADKILNSNANQMSKFEALSKLAGKVKNSFQNAYTFYVSGLIYQARGEDNDAYIDFKKALEIYPDNQYIRAEVVRLAKQLHMAEDYERYSKEVDKKLVVSPKNGEGKVVILFEHDYVPEKQEIKFPLVVFDQVHTVAFPTYSANAYYYKPLTLQVAGASVGSTAQIVDVSALAAKSLSERLPMIMIRQGLRFAARDQSKQALNGSLIGAVANIGHLLLNTADRRSWLTLPAGAQIMYSIVPKGEQQLTINVSGRKQNIPVKIMPGRMTVVHVVSAGGQLYFNTVNI